MDKQTRQPSDGLIQAHGGYRDLKSFQIAQLIYDLTVRFCDKYIEKKSRTHDQMVQAARSGVQNIAEGSQASGTSKKSELKLANVARASLEELRLDYEDYLRQRGQAIWDPQHPALVRFKRLRCRTVEEFANWVADERARMKNTDSHGPTQTDTDNTGITGPKNPSSSVSVRNRPCESVPSAVLAANAILSLLNACCYLLDRQLAALAGAFEKEGGFTERLYRKRKDARDGH